VHLFYITLIPNPGKPIFVIHSHKNLPILSSLNLLILQALTIFIYLKNRAGSDGYRCIMYRTADKWV